MSRSLPRKSQRWSAQEGEANSGEKQRKQVKPRGVE